MFTDLLIPYLLYFFLFFRERGAGSVQRHSDLWQTSDLTKYITEKQHMLNVGIWCVTAVNNCPVLA